MAESDKQTPPNYEPPRGVEELLQRYTAGERYFAQADIPDGADFSDVNLEGANLERSWLCDADFSGANLSGVIFCGANVKCADFSDSNLLKSDG